MYGNFRFTNSRMGEQRESCQVTTNIHVRHRSLHLFINSDSTTLRLLQIQVFEPETFRHRTATDAHQQLFCNDTAVSLCVLIRNNSSFFRLRQADHSRTKQEFNTSFCIFCTEQSGKLLIHSTQDFVHHLNHRHLYSQTIEERRKLHTDYPATNNSQRSRQFFTVQSIPVRPVVHRVHSRNRGNESFRACTKYQVLPFVNFLPAANRIFINDLRFSRYDCNIVGSQLRFHSQHQFTHYLTFTRYYLRQIERDFRDIDCILRCMFCTVISLCRIQQCFRRNTAFVQTDATQTILFDKQYAQTAFTGSFGSRISRRTATDDNHLIFHSI